MIDLVAFEHTLDGMGVDMSPIAFEEAFARIQRVADQSGKVSDTRVKAIVDEAISGSEALAEVAESFR